MNPMPPFPLFALLCPVAFAGNEEQGLLAHYPCDEGSGAVLRDASGNADDGAIHGGEYVPFADGWALRLDGVDDFVDCGSREGFSPTRAVTVEAWVCPEAAPGVGEAGIVAKSYETFALTYYTDGQCWWYISGGGNNCQAPLSLNAWHHVVGTFDGETLRLYLDGRLAATHASATREIGTGGALFIGKSAGDPKFTRGAHFRGLVDEVRVYARALSADEVRVHYRTMHLTNALSLACHPYPFLGQLIVRVDPRGLGDLPPGAEATIALRRPGRKGIVAHASISPLTSHRTAEVRFAGAALQAGEYEVTAQATTRAAGQMRDIGRPGVARAAWPKPLSWPGGGKKLRPLNNLVTELLSVRPGAAERAYEFTNPREGWVFVSSTAEVAGADAVQVALDLPAGPEVLTAHRAGNAPTQEAMRRLPAGEHRLLIQSQGGARLRRLTARAVPELVYARFGAHPHVGEFGPYDWAFLARYVLPNLNTMVGDGGEQQRPFAEQWKRQGKRWIVECSVPGLAEGSSVTPDEAEAFWTANPGLKDPLLDGIIADEFWAGDRPQYRAWTEAVRRIAANPALRGKTFYPYCGPMCGADLSHAFMKAVLDAGYRFALERYLPEQRTEEAARAFLDSSLRQQALEWREALPGSQKQMIVCFGYFSAPPESLDVDPAVNHKVYLDMQFNLVANDPAFAGVGGLMTYLSSYADEETVRWAGKLFRHYAIEGRADRLTSDPYLLPHLRNPDFEEGLDGWTVSPAGDGSVAVKSMSGYSWLEGRYPKTSQGDTLLWMKRSADRPNRVTQRIRALEPGRLYSLRAYTSDAQDLSVRQQLAVSIQVNGAEVLPERCFQHVFANCYSPHLGPFDAEHKAWMNYHWQVFRATGPDAELVISDWADGNAPGGPAGQELRANFVQVQPYDAP